MNDAKLGTIEQLHNWLAGVSDVSLPLLTSVQQHYEFVEQTLRHFGYARHGTEANGLLRAYLARMTGYSRGQLTRLLVREVSGAHLERRSIAHLYNLRG